MNTPNRRKFLGGIGAAARYELGLHLAPPTPPDFPWVTFAINISGSFALGAVMTIAAVTSRLRFSNAVYIAPARPLLEVAKQVASASVLSGGRVTLAAGVGTTGCATVAAPLGRA